MNMNKSGDGPSQPAVPAARATKPGHAFLRTGALVLIGLVLCWGVVSWVLREPVEHRDPAVAGAIERLRSGDPSERVSALRQVVQVGLADSDRSIPPVIEALGDADAIVRVHAAESLGMLGSYAVLAGPSGISQESGGPGLVSAVTSALLGSLAKDEQSVVRAAAAEGLRNISATSPRAAGKSKRGSKKGAGGSAEATTPSPSPVDCKAVVAALIAALGDRDDLVRSAAATALGGAGPRVSDEPPQPLVAALTDRSAATRAATAKALPNFPSGLDPVIPTLIRMSANDDPTVHEACAQALRQIERSAYSAAAIPALIEGLKDRDREVRLQAVLLLARLGTDATEAISALIATLKEPVDSDRTTGRPGGGSLMMAFTGPAHEAAKALGEIAPGTKSAGKAVAALAEVVRSGPPQRRASAADALGEFGPKAAAAVPDLIQMLKETDASKSSTPNPDGEAAAQALSRIAPGSPSSDAVVTALRDSLRSDSTMSRVPVIRALEQFGPKAAAAVPEIQALLQDPDPSVRKAASRALETLDQH